MTGGTPQALQVVGRLPRLRVVVGDFALQLGDVEGARLTVAGEGRQCWPTPLPTPVDAKGVRPLFSVYREEPLSVLRQAVSNGRPAEVIGPAGIGKSTLLRQLIWEDWGDRFPDGFIFESCDGLGPDDILQRIYDYFFDTHNRTDAILRPTRGEVLTSLKPKRALIVLDQLTLKGPPLDQLCGALPGCALFTGSHEAVLDGRSTHVFVEGLPEPSTNQLLRYVFGPVFDGAKGEVVPLLKPLSGHPLRVWQAAARLVTDPRNPRDDGALGNDGEALPAAVYDPKRGDTTRRLLRVLAAVSGAPISFDAAEDLAADGRRHRLESAVRRLRFEGMIVEEEESVRLAPNLETAARQMLPDLRPEVNRLMRWYIKYYCDCFPIPVAPTVPPAVMLLLERGSRLEMHPLVVDLVRVTELRWICRGQWDSWKRALEYHLTSAWTLRDEEEQAWALHELALCNLCRSDPLSAMANLERARRIRKRAEKKEIADLTQDNIETLIRLTTEPPPAY